MSAAARHAPLTRRLAVAGLLGLALAGTAMVSVAIFTGTTVTEGSRLGVGTIDVATAPVDVVLRDLDLTPGKAVAAPLEVRNDGSLELRWSMTATSDGGELGELVELEIRSGVRRCDPVGFTDSGTTLAGPTRFGSPEGDLLIGDPATGDDPGDRTLGPGGTETLCLRVLLPETVDEATGAGRSTSAVLRIDAEQTAHNP